MLFQIHIGRRGSPRLSFEVYAPDSVTAAAQALCLAGPLERVEVVEVAA